MARSHGLGYVIGAPFRAVGSLFTSLRFLLFDEPEDTTISGVIEKTLAQPSALLEHVVDFRKRLLWSLVGLAITTGVSFAFAQQILEFLTVPIGGIDKLTAIDVTEPVGVFMRVSLLCGFALALPWIAFQLWYFTAPGLSRRTRWSLLFSIPLLVIFFIGGMAFSYYIMLPPSLKFLTTFLDISQTPRVSTTIGLITGLLFWVGVAFEFPFVIYVLARVGILPAEGLAKQWRVAVVIIAVGAALITPTTDPVNMALLMAPMFLLYLLSVILAYMAQASRRREIKRRSRA